MPTAHPRSRGEHPSPPTPRRTARGSSPLTRGAPELSTITPGKRRLIPAHAGSTPMDAPRALALSAHPRSRGEHANLQNLWRDAHGSSPLTRGAPFAHTGHRGNSRLIPAHAGSTIAMISGLTVETGSSPLTRGAQIPSVTKPPSRGLIPAHAGSTCSMIGARSAPRAHPRSRGEHKTMATARNAHLGSSPLTRGARPSKCPYRTPTGLIPAHAGSTISAPPWPEEKAAHPRSRGEH